MDRKTQRRSRGAIAALIALSGVLALPAGAGAATHTFSANALVITAGGGGEAIAVACASGETTVNGTALATPTVPCADVQSLTVEGDAGNNTIDLGGVATASFTTLTSRTTNGNAGDDVITGSPTADTINGGQDTDTINGGSGNDTINGGLGDDNLTGGFANDMAVWNPGDGTDTFDGGSGTDSAQVNGDGSDDTFTIATDDDGTDVDRIAPAGGGHVEVSWLTEDITVSTGDGADTITGGAMPFNVTTNLTGGNGLDVIVGTEARDTITGGAADDIISGSGGDDTAAWSVGDGNDIFSGDAGSDTAQLTGDADAETFTAAPDDNGIDIDRTVPGAAHIEAATIERVTINGGDGGDTISASTGFSALGASASFSGGNGIDILTGSDANDSLAGGGDPDELTGGDGDDSFSWAAGGGNDTVHGGAGLDTAGFTGDASAETFAVAPNGDGIDFDQTVPSTAHTDADTIEQVSVNGGDGDDIITAPTGIAALGVTLSLSGGNHADTITGSDNADTITPGGGSDNVNGGAGDDRIVASIDTGTTDTDEGGPGDDTLEFPSSSGNDFWTIQPDSGRIKLQRGFVSPPTVSAGTIEHISLNLGSGHDSVTPTAGLGALGLERTTIVGDSGNDTIAGTDVPDTIDGGDGNDNIDGGDGNDMLSPGAGSGAPTDTVSGDAGDDTVTVTGDTSNETIAIAPNVSHVDVDRTAVSPTTNHSVDADGFEALTIDGGTGTDTITGSGGLAALDIDMTLKGGANNDTITGSDAAEAITGGGGTDTINGSGGGDTVSWNSGDGSDTVDGGDGTDRSVVNGDETAEQFTVTPNGSRVAFARTSTDPFTLDIGTTEQLELNAGAGNDQATAADGLGALIAVTLRGDADGDTLTGGNAAEQLSGGTGNDTLTGGAGVDTLGGDAGDDTIEARDGEADQVNCGDNTDTATADAVDTTTACETVSLPAVPSTPSDDPSAPNDPSTPSDDPSTPSNDPSTPPGDPSTPSNHPADNTNPVITALTITPDRFRSSSSLPTTSAAPRGTKIRFRLSEAATVTLTFHAIRAGRRVGGRCVRPTRANRSAQRCKRYVRKGRITFEAETGTRTVRFSGRLNRNTRLGVGRYRLTVGAKDAAGNTARKRTETFRIVRG